MLIKIKKFIFCLLVSTICILNARAASNPYKEYSSFGKNCTWFAWDQVYKKLGIALPGWGNANTWYDYAKKAGFEVGQTPRNNSIAVWQWDKYGHVAYVEKAVEDKIYIWDSSTCYDYVTTNQEEYDLCIKNGVSEETDRACYDKYIKLVPKACEYSASYWHVPGDLIGYVYLDNAPVKKGTNSSKNTTSVAKKSNNANLSKLEISDVEFEFKKDVLNYDLEVSSEITSLDIKATAEDKKAKVDVEKEVTLNIGTNSIKVVVTAEDGTKKIYTVNILKKDNNTYLSSLSIDNIDFSFDKEKQEYTINIPNDTDEITINGASESEKSSITGLGECKVDKDKTVEIVVTAENGETRTYKLELKKEIKEEEEKQKSNLALVVLLSIGGIAVISGVITFVALKIRKKKKIN